MIFIVRDKQKNELKEAKIILSLGPDRSGDTSGRIIVKTDYYEIFYVTFEDFFEDWEVVGELK